MRRLVVLPVAVALASVGVGFAAGLAVDNNSVGAGVTAVGRCHEGDAPAVTYTTAGSDVTEVVISDLDSTCDGAALTLVVVDASGTSVGSGTATVASSGASVALTSPTPAAQLAGVEIAMVGP